MGRAPINITDTPVSQGIQQIIERAIKNSVSDVHIEPSEYFILVRYRRGGLLYTANKLPKSGAEQIACHIKKLASLDIKQTRVPQSGQYQLSIGQDKYSIEVATLPTLDGEKLTLRIRKNTTTSLDLEELGLWGDNLSLVERVLASPYGLVVVAGRQNSRINTTLATMLQSMTNNLYKAAFISSETTYLPKNIKQVTIRNTGLPATKQLELLIKDGLTTIGLDIVADRATAKLAIEASLARKFILVGIAADNALTGIKTLQQISRSHLVPAAVNLVIGQSFVPKLCDYCREAYEPSEVELNQLTQIFKLNRSVNMQQLHKLEQQAIKAGLADKQPLSSTVNGIHRLWQTDAHGCSHCDYTGYTTEIGIFEVCEPSDRLRKQLTDNDPISELQRTAIKDGMLSLPVDALIKALRGLIDFQTLLNVYATTN